MKETPNVRLSASIYLHDVLPSQFELHIGIENYNMQRLMKPFVSFTHCPCPLYTKILQKWHWFAFSFACKVNEQTWTAPLCRYNPPCGQRWNYICTVRCYGSNSAVGLHVIELYTSVMTEKRNGQLSLAPYNINSSALLKYTKEGERAESTNGHQRDRNTALCFDSFTAVKNLWFNTVLQSQNRRSNNRIVLNRNFKN